MEGYIKLFRKIKENELWLEPRRFHKLEAWIDVLLRANHKEAKVTIGNKTFHVDKGQFITSQIKLSEAWNWNRETVRKFLDLLKSSNQIDYETSNKFTRITISNWDSYQNPISGNPASKPALKRHQNSIKTSTNNNEKNEKNKRKAVFSSLGAAGRFINE